MESFYKAIESGGDGKERAPLPQFYHSWAQSWRSQLRRVRCGNAELVE
jgi:hypothetical protein